MLTSQPTSVTLQLAHAHEERLRLAVRFPTTRHGPTVRVRLGTWMVRVGVRVGGALRPVGA